MIRLLRYYNTIKTGIINSLRIISILLYNTYDRDCKVKASDFSKIQQMLVIK